MIVSWNWLKEYVNLSMPREQLEERLMMTGLNHEGTERIGDDWAIDLEVTSNRPDCLGHIGVAREIGIIFDQPLSIPAAEPAASDVDVGDLTSIDIQCPELCPRYTARVIRDVKVGPSPAWLADRLRTLGISVINNIVDISNYVMLECGQPLHAFDFAKLRGCRIVVREAIDGEEFTAIDHREYTLKRGMCVIADGQRAVALGGVMGGADTEVSEGTTDLLIEAADFDPIAIRTTARALQLHSPSSYRFERTVDPVGIDWASRRCCELILKLAGGKLAKGVCDEGTQSPKREPIVLRFDQLERVLGIAIAENEVRQILRALGNVEQRCDDKQVQVVPPSWRRDLTREIDLVEEVARLHGYEKIPEDTAVAMAPSRQSDEDRVTEQVRLVLCSAGFDEAMTLSAVEEDLQDVFGPWTGEQSMRTSSPVLRRANWLRQSVVPSLLAARRNNETLFNECIELFEVARVYLPQGNRQLPRERRLLAICSGQDFTTVKGVVEVLVARVASEKILQSMACDEDLFEAGRCCELQLDGERFGFLGEVSSSRCDQFDLRGVATIVEVDLDVLTNVAQLVPTAQPRSSFPPVSRDLNIVIDQSVPWADVERIARTASGELLESLTFCEEYRDSERIGADKKSLLFSVSLRSLEQTLTNQQADEIRDRIAQQLTSELGGQLRA